MKDVKSREGTKMSCDRGGGMSEGLQEGKPKNAAIKSEVGG